MRHWRYANQVNTTALGWISWLWGRIKSKSQWDSLHRHCVSRLENKKYKAPFKMAIVLCFMQLSYQGRRIEQVPLALVLRILCQLQTSGWGIMLTCHYRSDYSDLNLSKFQGLLKPLWSTRLLLVGINIYILWRGTTNNVIKLNSLYPLPKTWLLNIISKTLCEIYKVPPIVPKYKIHPRIKANFFYSKLLFFKP